MREERHTADAVRKRRKVVVIRHTNKSKHVERLAKLFKEKPKEV